MFLLLFLIRPIRRNQSWTIYFVHFYSPPLLFLNISSWKETHKRWKVSPLETRQAGFIAVLHVLAQRREFAFSTQRINQALAALTSFLLTTRRGLKSAPTLGSTPPHGVGDYWRLGHETYILFRDRKKTEKPESLPVSGLGPVIIHIIIVNYETMSNNSWAPALMCYKKMYNSILC